MEDASIALSINLNLELPVRIMDHMQLVWSCVELGQYRMQKFILRNVSKAPILVELTTTDPQYRLRYGVIEAGVDENAYNHLKFELPCGLCRTLRAYFEPVIKGPCESCLDLIHYSALLGKPIRRNDIYLYGYGGCATIHFYGEKLFAGNIWIDLGVLKEDSTTLLATLTFNNTGDIPGFVYAEFESDTLLPFPVVLTLTDPKFVIEPRRKVPLHINYTATPAEMQYFDENQTATGVFNLGLLKFYVGEEFVRRRLIYNAVKVGRNGGAVPEMVTKLSSVFCHQKRWIHGVRTNDLEENANVRDMLLREIRGYVISVNVNYHGSYRDTV